MLTRTRRHVGHDASSAHQRRRQPAWNQHREQLRGRLSTPGSRHIGHVVSRRRRLDRVSIRTAARCPAPAIGCGRPPVRPHVRQLEPTTATAKPSVPSHTLLPTRQMKRTLHTVLVPWMRNKALTQHHHAQLLVHLRHVVIRGRTQLAAVNRRHRGQGRHRLRPFQLARRRIVRPFRRFASTLRHGENCDRIKRANCAPRTRDCYGRGGLLHREHDATCQRSRSPA